VLARKMPGESGDPLTAESLQVRLEEHLGNVREMYNRVIQARKPMYYTLADGDVGRSLATAGFGSAIGSERPRYRWKNARRDWPPRWRALKVNRGRERFEHFLDQMSANPEMASRLDAERRAGGARGGYLRAQPVFRRPASAASGNAGRSGSGAAPPEDPIADPPPTALAAVFFRRRMFRIQSDSLLGPAPIFETLERTSDLADTVIAAAYRIALAEAPPRQSRTIRPAQQMMVVSLGRLGMREFDLASDADLIFVIPDEDAPSRRSGPPWPSA
jgi:[glutamine synthetase] adenylyltransferase / [glutamine synthetase]-adenylyl-L-tyrosine phosphorylase